MKFFHSEFISTIISENFSNGYCLLRLAQVENQCKVWDYFFFFGSAILKVNSNVFSFGGLTTTFPKSMLNLPAANSVLSKSWLYWYLLPRVLNRQRFISEPWNFRSDNIPEFQPFFSIRRPWPDSFPFGFLIIMPRKWWLLRHMSVQQIYPTSSHTYYQDFDTIMRFIFFSFSYKFPEIVHKWNDRVPIFSHSTH